MTEQGQVYRCYICGNIVEVVLAGGGELVCCGQRMVLLKPKAEQGGRQEHRPIIEATDTHLRVRVGKTSHPAESGHYIEWIEALTAEGVFRKWLKPTDEPVAEFALSETDVRARAYCSRGGLWQS